MHIFNCQYIVLAINSGQYDCVSNAVWKCGTYCYYCTTLNPLVVPAEQAWEMATVNGAKVLGFENLGKLEAGYLADIVLWDMHKPYWYPRHNKLSLLVYAANANDADTVLVAGKVVLANGKLPKRGIIKGLITVLLSFISGAALGITICLLS